MMLLFRQSAKSVRWYVTTTSGPSVSFVSFTHPHDPYIMTQEYWDRYTDEEIDMPIVPPLPLHQLDPHSQRLWLMCASDEFEINEQHIRNARHGA